SVHGAVRRHHRAGARAQAEAGGGGQDLLPPSRGAERAVATAADRRAQGRRPLARGRARRAARRTRSAAAGADRAGAVDAGGERRRQGGTLAGARRRLAALHHGDARGTGGAEVHGLPDRVGGGAAPVAARLARLAPAGGAHRLAGLAERGGAIVHADLVADVGDAAGVGGDVLRAVLHAPLGDVAGERGHAALDHHQDFAGVHVGVVGEPADDVVGDALVGAHVAARAAPAVAARALAAVARARRAVEVAVAAQALLAIRVGVVGAVRAPFAVGRGGKAVVQAGFFASVHGSSPWRHGASLGAGA